MPRRAKGNVDHRKCLCTWRPRSHTVRFQTLPWVEFPRRASTKGMRKKDTFHTFHKQRNAWQSKSNQPLNLHEFARASLHYSSLLPVWMTTCLAIWLGRTSSWTCYTSRGHFQAGNGQGVEVPCSCKILQGNCCHGMRFLIEHDETIELLYLFLKWIQHIYNILGTRELGLVKDTPGWTSPISLCAGPPPGQVPAHQVSVWKQKLCSIFLDLLKSIDFYKNLVRHGPLVHHDDLGIN